MDVAVWQPQRPHERSINFTLHVKDCMYIDDQALCEMFSVSRETSRRWRVECGLPHIVLPGGGIRYEPRKVQGWLHSSMDVDNDRQKFVGVFATQQTIEAAFLRANAPDVAEQSYDSRTLQMSEDQFSAGLSLRELIMGFALRAGYDDANSLRDIRGQMKALKAAAINAAASGPSTMTLESVLSNVANKFIRAGWAGVDRTAIDAISASRSTKDFKNSPSYRLTGDLKYALVTSGEIKHGDVDAVGIDNQLESYARIVSVPRAYLLNDDAGFFDALLKRGLGRGAALSFAEVFWSVFLGDPAFWSAANKNLIEGASSALDVDSLGQAVNKLENQKDERGQPCNMTAAWIITSSENKISGQRLVGAERLTMRGSDGTTTTTKNPFTKLQHASSTYLGSETTPNADPEAWWVCASPDDVPTVEVLYLMGKSEPTIEQARLDFDSLGMQFRGVHDFAAALVEPRASVKAAGK